MTQMETEKITYKHFDSYAKRIETKMLKEHGCSLSWSSLQYAPKKISYESDTDSLVVEADWREKIKNKAVSEAYRILQEKYNEAKQERKNRKFIMSKQVYILAGEDAVRLYLERGIEGLLEAMKSDDYPELIPSIDFIEPDTLENVVMNVMEALEYQLQSAIITKDEYEQIENLQQQLENR